MELKKTKLNRRNMLIGGSGVIAVGGAYLWPSDYADYLRNAIFEPFGIPTPERPRPTAVMSGEGLENFAPNAVLFKYFGTFASKNVYGSGFFIAPDLILTAAHVAALFSGTGKTRIFHNPSLGKPSNWVIPKHVHVLKDWVDDGMHSGYDIGLIRVQPIAEKVTVKFSDLDPNNCSTVVNNSGSLKCLAFWGSRITGLDSFERQYHSGGVCMSTDRALNRLGLVGGHDAPTFPKWSGAPVLQPEGGSYRQIGVHVRGEKDVNLYAPIGNDLQMELDKLKLGARNSPQFWRKLWGD